MSRRWVLLRGLTRDAHHWHRFPAQLQARLPGIEIHTPDLPGNGLRNAERSPDRIGAMAQQCRAALRDGGVEPPYRLLAVSLGGMVATAWAAQAPGELDACVLINTSMKPFSLPHRRLRPTAWPLALRMLLAPPSDRECERQILALTSNRAIDGALLDDWAQWRGKHRVSRANALRQLWAAARYTAPAQPLRTPTLVLASRADRLADVSCSRALARAWRSPCIEHPDAGHDLTLDDPDWVARQVADWAQGLPA